MITPVLSVFPFPTLCSVMPHALCKSTDMFSPDNTDIDRVKAGERGQISVGIMWNWSLMKILLVTQTFIKEYSAEMYNAHHEAQSLW